MGILDFILRKNKGRKWVQENFEDPKKALDGLPKLDYTMDTNSEKSGPTGVTGYIPPNDGPASQGTVMNNISLDKIANSTAAGEYPAQLVVLAKTLRDMKVNFNLQASEFAKTIFSAQDDLGISSADVEAAIKAIINQRKAIDENIGAVLAAIVKTT